MRASQTQKIFSVSLGRRLLLLAICGMLLQWLATPGSSKAQTIADARISVGWLHSCVLQPDKTVKCWGLNANGQLGNGTTASSLVPVSVSGLSNVLQVAAGGSHTCALIQGGTVKCWGAHTWGQLGTDHVPFTYHPLPVQVITSAGALTGVTAITAGENHSCALLSNSSVRCWGANNYAQLGAGYYGGSGDMYEYADFFVENSDGSMLTGVTQLDASWNHTCARLSNGSARCWGASASGQIGFYPYGSTYVYYAYTPNGLVAGSGVLKVTAGGWHSCALMATGGAKCWGDIGSASGPTDIAGVSGGVDIEGGTNHDCVRQSGGGLLCWGQDTEGQLGNGTPVPANRVTPVAVQGLDGNVFAFSAGGNNTCAIMNSNGGTISCWGDNSQGQIGDSMKGPYTVAPAASGWLTTPAAASEVSDVALGQDHTCAIKAGALKCWGKNSQGQLGSGAAGTPIPTPTEVTLSLPVSNVVAGYNHTCVIHLDRSVSCWGSNSHGQLGSGVVGSNSATPTLVTGVAGATALAAGENYTCALNMGGTVQCWGANNYGQLGNGTTTASLTPVSVSGLANVTAIAANRAHSCARLSDGTARCWGENISAQIGNNSTVNALTPVSPKLPGATAGSFVDLSNVQAIAAGAWNSCAVIGAEGRLWCWGNPNGTGTANSAPWVAKATALYNVSSVWSGRDTTCMRVANGTIKCFGQDWAGQFMDGTGANSAASNLPSSARWLPAPAAQVVSNGYHTCAILTTGKLYCAGANGSGQLGTGAVGVWPNNNVHSLTPVTV